VTGVQTCALPIFKMHTLKQFEEIVPGHLVDLFFTANKVPKDGVLEGDLVEMDESGAQRVYTRTSQHLQVEWNESSKLIMGGKEDLVVGATLRVTGTLDQKDLVRATHLVVLTRVANLS